MQISKLSIIVCAAAFAVLPFSLRADTEAQARAREALEKKLKELQTQPAQTTPEAVPAPKPPKKAPVPKPQLPEAAKATEQAQPAAPPAPAPESEAVQKARDALRQKQNELNAQPAAPAPAPAPEVAQPTPKPPKKAKPAKPAPAPAVQPEPAQSEITAAPGLDPQKLEQAREAMHQKMEEITTKEGVPAAAPAVANTPAPARPAPAKISKAEAKQQEAEAKQRAHDAQAQADKAMAERERQQVRLEKPSKQLKPVRSMSGWETIPGPPLPISEDKQAQLAELLRKYKADEITPEQYQAERAKIIGAQ